MLPEEFRRQAAERLVENIRSYGDHLTTGFPGTPYLCELLSRFGYKDLELIGIENGNTIIKAGSGHYHFEVKK